jgi:hypothetical protein
MRTEFRSATPLSVWSARSTPPARVLRKFAANEPPPLQLTDDQVAFFWREGYLSIPQLTTPDEIAWLQEVYDRLFDDQVGWARGDFFDLAGTDDPDRPPQMPQLMTPCRYQPALASTLHRRNATTVARQLLHPGAKVIFDHAVLKPARTGPVTPWHQDQAFFPVGVRHQSVTVWMPLQDVDVESGCMQFVPRSHLLPMLPHRSMNDDPRVHAIEAVDPDLSVVARCPLPAGGATVHHYRTLHGSGPNTSTSRRRAYALVYCDPSKKVRVRKDYPWNARKQTARLDRYRSSRTVIDHLRDHIVSARARWL